MTLTDRQRTDRLRKRADRARALDGPRRASPLEGWTFDGAPLAHGAAWPTRDGVVALALDDVEVPADWPLEEARLDVDLGGEGLLRIAYADGAERGLRPRPQPPALPAQGPPLRGQRRVRRAPALRRAEPRRPPRPRPADPARPGPRRARRSFSTQVADTAEVLAGHEVVPPLLAAAEDALARLDWPTATAAYVARVAPGRQIAADLAAPRRPRPAPAGPRRPARAAVAAAAELPRASACARCATRYPQTGALALTGHAHIDLAWLWPLDETRRKANRTFSTMIGLMDRHPDFRFNQSTAQLYAFLEEDDPALFARIKEKVAAGQWEPIGAMWVEPDTNMPTGESFVRQLLYGQRYFERTFGRRHTVCWLPDCFGFSPALPQLLNQAGVTSFFTIKVNWSETNVMPYDLFWWEGLDGSRVLAHTFDNPVGGYNAEIGARADRRDLEELPRQAPPSRRACSPSATATAAAARPRRCSTASASSPTSPWCRRCARPRSPTGSPRSTPPSASDPDLPVWVGEIYLELHRGTLTTQGRTKYLHRRAERALITAETLSSAWRRCSASRAAGSLEDALARAPAQRVPRHPARLEHPRGLRAGRGRARRRRRRRRPPSPPRPASRAIAARIVPARRPPGVLVVNPDLSPRPLRLASPDPLPGGQAVDGGSVLAGAAAVPGLTAAVIVDAAAAVRPHGRPTARSRTPTSASRSTDDGTLASVFDKRAGREALAGRGNQIWAYVDKPRSWDAWDIEESYAAPGRGDRRAQRSRSSSAARTAPRSSVVRRFRDSEIVQTCGSGPTRPGSSSRPTSTGTTAASCSRPASRSRSAPTTPPSNARTA